MLRGDDANCELSVDALLLALPAAAGAQPPPAKAEIVMVAGCLREPAAGEWRVVNATEPTPSTAGAPAAADLPPLPVAGKHQFHLIGVSVFDLPTHKDRTVVVKGLLVPAKPMSRLNLTSVVTVAPGCGPAK